jgi:nicotinamide mononucleotide adenylyltransferase
MQPALSSRINVRPIQQRDFYAVQTLNAMELEDSQFSITSALNHQPISKEFSVGQAFLLGWLPLTLSDRLFVAESEGEVVGMIWVTAFNHSRSTWQIERIAIATQVDYFTVGTSLIRHALEACWEARTWLLQVDVQSKQAIALYRQNGFQPLAHLTNWQISEALVTELASQSAALPNLLPVNNADAPLIYQLDTAAMPPQIRQVYDLGINDFRSNLWANMLTHGQQLFSSTQEISGYVYETQRKAAIGYFSLLLQTRHHDRYSHRCHMTIHPAYTWLYPEVISQVSKVIEQHQKVIQAKQVSKQLNAKDSNQTSDSSNGFTVSSTDYQPEREAYLEEIQAERVNHGLLMGRSVWHKVRESRLSLESLQLSKVLAGLQPAQRPIPGRIENFPPHPIANQSEIDQYLDQICSLDTKLGSSDR